jgi:trans-aconitate methyltransferase
LDISNYAFYRGEYKVTNKIKIMSKNTWNAGLYEDKHSFVWQYSEDLIELLSPQKSEFILDLGCGTGQLTQQIATVGAEVMGIDYAPTMIEQAEKNYPNLKFTVADARNFEFSQLFDAIFSNAALHWVTEPEAAINCIWKALKPGGRFVAEFGGKGNVQSIVEALESGLQIKQNLWYFPSIAEYATLLEQQGFCVTYAKLFERPTPLDGEAGMANWMQMFCSNLFSEVPPNQQNKVIQEVEQCLRPRLYRDNVWFADYKRIRVMAIKN